MHKTIDKTTPIHSELINWYRENKRDLPWRNTKNPYKIWLSEIILQQTKVAQGLAYYQKFSKNYPTIFELANASEIEVMKDWQGLGYYSRARNLHLTAKHIAFERKGNFPSTFEEIKQLKGVGDYTAAAIASFAFDLPHAVLDGNVYRLLSRLFGIHTPINKPKAKKEFSALANQLLPNQMAAEFNQAIMEFGALQCKPKKPNCESCPFQTWCFAYENKKIDRFPVKEKPIKQKKRYFNYLLFIKDSKIFIKRRVENDIWKELYDFPLIEKNKTLSLKQLLNSEEFTTLKLPIKPTLEFRSEEFKHILSHQIIFARFYHFKISELETRLPLNYELIELKNLSTYPIPKLLENYLREKTNFLSLST